MKFQIVPFFIKLKSHAANSWAKVLSFFLPHYSDYKNFFLKCTVHSVFMILFTLYWMNLPLVLAHEFSIMSEVQHINHWLKNTFNNSHEKNELSSIAKSFLLIDVSESQALKYNDNNCITSEVVTNRYALARVLKEINKAPHKISQVVCDIILTDSAVTNRSFLNCNDCPYNTLVDSSDKILSSEIKKLDSADKILILDVWQNENYKKNIFQASGGLAQYNPSFNRSFYKFNFFENEGTIKQLPLKLFERTANIASKYFSFFNFEFFLTDKQLHLNTIIPVFSDYIQEVKEFNLKNNNPLENINLLCSLETFSIADLNDEKPIIIIGDFKKNDIHYTLIGPAQGPALILNLYLHLKNGTTIVKFISFIFTLFICFFIISYNTIYKHKNQVKRRLRKQKKSLRKNLMIDIQIWLKHHMNFILLILLLFVCLNFFKQYIYVLATATYLVLVEIYLKVKSYF